MDINHDLFEPRGERNRQRNYASIAFSREIFNLRLNRLIFTKYQIPEYMELQENVWYWQKKWYKVWITSTGVIPTHQS